MHNKQDEISNLAIKKEQEINNAQAEAGNLFKLSGKNVVDLMDKAFSKFQSDGKKIIDDTFISKVFNNIAKKVKPFEEYMEYIFEHDKSSQFWSFKNEEKVTPWDLLRCDLMFPTRRDIIQSNPMTAEVGIHAAIIVHK